MRDPANYPVLGDLTPEALLEHIRNPSAERLAKLRRAEAALELNER